MTWCQSPVGLGLALGDGACAGSDGQIVGVAEGDGEYAPVGVAESWGLLGETEGKAGIDGAAVPGDTLAIGTAEGDGSSHGD